MVGDGDQAARRQDVDVGARPGGFGTAGMRADQALAFRVGADRRRQRAGDGGDGAVERQLAEHDIGRERIAGDGAERRHQAERDRQVVVAAFLGQVGGREVDRHLLRRHRQAGSMQRRLHALAALGHRLVGQADDVDVGLARRDHDLDVHRHRLDALERNRAHARNHAAPPNPAADGRPTSDQISLYVSKARTFRIKQEQDGNKYMLRLRQVAASCGPRNKSAGSSESS